MKTIDSNELQDYVHQWGARHVPFQDQPGQALFQTEHTDKAIALLNQSAALRSVMLLSGGNGVGKRAVVAHWLRSLDPKVYRSLVLTQASMGASGVLCALLAKLGQTPGMRRSKNIVLMEEALKSLGRTIPLIVLDEAQNYTVSAMEEVRLLLGLNLPAQPAFCLILIGDNYLLDSLRLQSRRALYTRIAASFLLPALDPEQVEPFLVHALKLAGIERPAFEPAAVNMITAASEGVPRVINLLARASWIEASRLQHSSITPEHLHHALQLIPVARDKITGPQNS